MIGYTLTLMTSAAFFFEVLDKEMSIQTIWVSCFVVAFAGFLLCRWRWWLVSVTLPVSFVFGLIMLSEFLDPYIGASMWAESHSYVIQMFAAVAVAMGFPVVGAFLQWRKANERRSGSYN